MAAIAGGVVSWDNTGMSDREREVLLAMQMALLDEVSDRVRAVSVSWTDTTIHFDSYFDGEIADDDRESMACVDTELVAWFPESHTITHTVHRLDYPQRLPQDNRRVFSRREYPLLQQTPPQ